MKLIKSAIAIVGAPAFALLTGCITYPYQTAFDSCDVEAGACYRYCEDVARSDYELGACHNECDRDANQCFASAYDSYSYGGSAYGGAYSQPSWPWYGRYGAWGPSSGFYFDFDSHGRSNGYDRPRRGRGQGRRGRRRGPGGSDASGNPPNDGGGRGGGPDGGRQRDGRNNNDQGSNDGRREGRTRDPRGASDNNAQPPRDGRAPPPPVPQTAPPASKGRAAPPKRPAKPAKERSGSGNTEPEDY